MKVYVLFLTALCCAFGLTSAAQAALQEPVIKVACVGDSITEGTANVDHAINSWPLILERMLERAQPGVYEVRNFGRSGATALRRGVKPYWNQDVFSAGCDFQPNIVIINLGTNDATNVSWLKCGEEFEQDYRDLIKVYQGLESKPQIWLSNLTPMIAPHPRVEENAPHRVEIEHIITALANEFDLPVIDFKTPMSGLPKLLTDGVHPNTAGNELMALAAFAALMGQEGKADPSIRPHMLSGAPQFLVQNGQAMDVRLGLWQQKEKFVTGTGASKNLVAKIGLAEGDFHMRTRLRLVGQKNSAAGFVMDGNFFGFEGNTGRVFRNGAKLGRLRLLFPAELMWPRDSWIDFEVIRNGGMVWYLVNGTILDMAPIPGRIEELAFDPNRSNMEIAEWSIVGKTFPSTKITLFESGQQGVHTYRIPALVTTNSGTLIACCDARINSGGDLPNNIDTVIRRSTDGGKSWLPIQNIIDWSGKEGTADPSLVVDRDTGRIWCAVTWSESVNWHNAKPGFGRDTFHNLLVYSDDDGLTWSEPVDITKSLKDPSWRSVWFSPGNGIQTTTGRLVLPFSAADASGADSSWAAISDDHGKTWSRVGPTGTKTNESIIAQLADGTLICNLRSRHGFKLRGVSSSSDDGDHWSPMEHHQDLIEPVCQASLLTVPKALTPNGKDWLVFCNPASTKREKLTVRVSFDGGETWPHSRLIHAGPTAYSCMSLLPQGGIGILYERGSTNSYEGISFAPVPLQSLLDSDPTK